MADDFDLGDLYATLGLTPAASREEILDAYKKELIAYESTAKNSRKTKVFKEVGKAFSVLSDASRRKQYDDSNIIPDTPKTRSRRKSLKHAEEYQVIENRQSITVYFPGNTAKSWLDSCEEYYGTQAVNDGDQGYQIKTSHVDPKTGLSVGSVSIKIYETTQKMLIQGSAYLLWYSEVFPELKKKLSQTQNNHGSANVQQASVGVEHVSTSVTPSSTDIPLLCSSCDQPVMSEVCNTCTTVPKVLFDVNSNETHEDTQSVVLDDDRNETGENVNGNDEIKKDPCSLTDLSVLQDSMNKLEACLANSISDRKLFEDFVAQRMNTIESKMKTQVCIEVPSTDKKQLQDEIAQLTEAKCELQNQIDSLQLKYDELALAVGMLQTTAPLKTTETQTTDESSERAEKLLREVATISTQNRFQVLADNNGVSGKEARTDISNRSAKRRDHGAKPTTKQTSCVDKVNTNQHNKTAETNQQHRELPPDVLILGDSNTKGIKTDLLCPNKCAKSDVTYNITQATEYVEQTTLPDPHVILFHLGTNDARDTRDATSVSERFRKLVHITHEKYPRTQIVLSSILPRDDPDLQQVGDNVNSFLRVISEETKYVHLIDNSNLSDMGLIKRRLYSHDGYHLNRFGIRVLAANIKRVINPLIGLGQYTNRGARLNQSPTHNQSPVSPGISTTHGQGQRPHPIATYERDFPRLNQTLVNGPSVTRNYSDALRQGQSSSAPQATGAPAASRPTPLSGPLQSASQGQSSRGSVNATFERFAPAAQESPPPVRPFFRPNQPSGPWRSPPPPFNLPPTPWGFLPPNVQVPGPHSRMNSPPWPWHPAMMWPPMVTNNMW